MVREANVEQLDTQDALAKFIMLEQELVQERASHDAHCNALRKVLERADQILGKEAADELWKLANENKKVWMVRIETQVLPIEFYNGDVT